MPIQQSLSILGGGGSGGYNPSWNPTYGTNQINQYTQPTNKYSSSQAQLPSFYNQQQRDLVASMPQSFQGMFGSNPGQVSGSGALNPMASVSSSSQSYGTNPYAQQIQQLGQRGVMSINATLPGGRQVGPQSTGPVPAGVDPMDLIAPTMVGQTMGAGGQMSGGTPVYSPYGQTGYQKAAQGYSGMRSAPTIAHAFNDYSLGLGPPTKGTGMDYATMGKWLGNPDVQKNLAWGFSPSSGYQNWQQQNNWSSLLGDLSSWTGQH